MRLSIEPMIARPDMPLRTFAEAVELVRKAAHPGVTLTYDTGHLTAMGDPLLESFVEAYSDISVVQLADMPGRVEVGGGEIDFAPILAHAIRCGYAGLIDLEHDWTNPGANGERQGLERLAATDAAARRLAGAIG